MATSLWVGIDGVAAVFSYASKQEYGIPAGGIKVPPITPVPSSKANLIVQGDRISLNGRILPAAWSQWQLSGDKTVRIAVSDAGLIQTIGVELQSSSDITRQPVQWFSQPATQPMVLATWLTKQYRYADITDLAKAFGWQMQVNGTTLQINSPPATVQEIRQGKQDWGERIVIDLDRPTPWQVTQDATLLTLRIDAQANPALIERFHPQPDREIPAEVQGSTGLEGDNPLTLPPNPAVPQSVKVESNQNQTTVKVNIPKGLRPRVSSLTNPDRLVIDLAPEVMVERDIMWAPGLRYRQQIIGVGNSRFPVVWLEINPRQPGLKIKPIWSYPNSLTGIAPLVQIAQQSEAAAAINGGFFNRDRQLPLGAIRRDGNWISSPILNRGAIAWNDVGEFKIGHLTLQESLITSSRETLPIVSVNSGYTLPGIARYTPAWGSTYTPLTDNETIIVVQSDRVENVLPAGVASQMTFPIPASGYLLVLRSTDNFPIQPGGLLAIGTRVSIQNQTIPTGFNRYPNILGAGPLLLQNRQVVLNAKAEQFRDSFIRESAYRSAIGTTSVGTLIIATAGNRTGGAGPTLSEIAEIMQRLGAIDALNLDGGSSTSLYLGGQLINRSPRTAARVHNGLGIFLNPNL